LLQTLDQKVEGFGVLGIQQTIVVRFTEEFSMIPAGEFLRDVVNERLQAKEVYLGKGFAFGHNREGNIELLSRIGSDLGFVAGEVPEVSLRGRRVSSSRIRELLARGKVNFARRMLGRPYGVEGRVERGAERGQQLGFPTANLHPQNRVIPENGVYVTGTLIDGHWCAAHVWGREGTFSRDFRNELVGGSLRRRSARPLPTSLAQRAEVWINRRLESTD
jgi:riboflavin kinase/FMN adenylyltransferase